MSRAQGPREGVQAQRVIANRVRIRNHRVTEQGHDLPTVRPRQVLWGDRRKHPKSPPEHYVNHEPKLPGREMCELNQPQPKKHGSNTKRMWKKAEGSLSGEPVKGLDGHPTPKKFGDLVAADRIVNLDPDEESFDGDLRACILGDKGACMMGCELDHRKSSAGSRKSRNSTGAWPPRRPPRRSRRS